MTKEINYAEIGSELEASQDAEYLLGFAKKFNQSTDSDMAKLATFARFRAEAVACRLAGRINEASISEANAETVYNLEISPSNRW